MKQNTRNSLLMFVLLFAVVLAPVLFSQPASAHPHHVPILIPLPRPRPTPPPADVPSAPSYPAEPSEPETPNPNPAPVMMPRVFVHKTYYGRPWIAVTADELALLEKNGKDEVTKALQGLVFKRATKLCQLLKYGYASHYQVGSSVGAGSIILLPSGQLDLLKSGQARDFASIRCMPWPSKK